MEPRYKPLPIHEQTTDQVLTLRPRSLRSFWIIPLAVVTLFNIGILFVSLHVVHAAGRLDSSTSAHGPINSLTASLPIATTNESVAGNVAKVELLPVDYVAFHWDTPWGSHNVTEADQLWESLNTAHGHIAIDHAWATANQVSIFQGYRFIRITQSHPVAIHNGRPRQTGKGFVPPAGLSPASLPCTCIPMRSHRNGTNFLWI